MEFFNPNTLIDFMKWRTLCVTISAIACIATVIAFFYPGPNYGTDFLGGTEIQVAFRGDVGAEELRAAVEELGYQSAEVVAVVGHRNEYIIRVRDFSAMTGEQAQQVEQAIGEALPEGVSLERMRAPEGGDSVRMELSGEVDPSVLQGAFEGAGIAVLRVTRTGQGQDYVYEAQLEGVAGEMLSGLEQSLGAERGPQTPERIERVGPRAGAQLRDAAILSLVYAVAFIMVYVAFRFDLRFAPGAVIALIHDAIITVGVFILLQKEFNLTIIAALLTIVGFSINDTIVIYDRIRENFGRLRDKSLRELINISTSEMLSRTIITNGTALLSVSAFFIWGTDVIRDLSFALFIGILVGTYSTIYIAAPVTEWADRRFFSRSKSRAKKARLDRRQEA